MLGNSRVKHVPANSGTFHGDESPGRFCNKHHKKKQNQILAGFANDGLMVRNSLVDSVPKLTKKQQIKSKLGSWWLNQPIRKNISQIEKKSLPQIGDRNMVNIENIHLKCHHPSWVGIPFPVTKGLKSRKRRGAPPSGQRCCYTCRFHGAVYLPPQRVEI